MQYPKAEWCQTTANKNTAACISHTVHKTSRHIVAVWTVANNVSLDYLILKKNDDTLALVYENNKFNCANYHKLKNNELHLYWRCNQSHQQCKAKFITTIDNDNPDTDKPYGHIIQNSVVNKHNHDDKWTEAAAKRQWFIDQMTEILDYV